MIGTSRKFHAHFSYGYCIGAIGSCHNQGLYWAFAPVISPCQMMRNSFVKAWHLLGLLACPTSPTSWSPSEVAKADL